jgi:hypothetical protein
MVGHEVRAIAGGVDEARYQNRQGGAVQIIETAEVVDGGQIEGEFFGGFPFGGAARLVVAGGDPATGKAEVARPWVAIVPGADGASLALLPTDGQPMTVLTPVSRAFEYSDRESISWLDPREEGE